MNNKKFQKITVLLIAMLAVQFTFGSIIGSVSDKSKSKYSLKNFNTTYKGISPYSLRGKFAIKGSEILGVEKFSDNSLEFNSIIRYERGNTSYVYPYKHVVTVPKFKTPLDSRL